MPDTVLILIVFLVLLAVAAALAGPLTDPPRAGTDLVSVQDSGRPVLADDMAAVRAAFDRMLLRKGLITAAQLALIRHGTRCRGIITGMRATGGAREDYREVELDLMVSKPEGGQFPARETTLVPESALAEVSPGSVVDAYYRLGDESTVAVCVPPH